MSDKQRSLQSTLLFAGLLLTTLFSAIYLYQPKSLETLNLKITDIILSSVKAPQSRLDIVTVAIDDASVDKYGQWPWPRYRVAQLLEKIAKGGARSVGIDIIFAERDRSSPRIWQETLEHDHGYVIDTSSIPPEILDHDIYLADVLAKGPFVLAHTFLFDQAAETKLQYCTLHPISFAHKKESASSTLVHNSHQATGVICNYEVLAAAASGSGFLNASPDIDGVIRRLPLLINYEGNFYPSFALAVLMQAKNLDVLGFQSDSTWISRFSLAEYTIPTDEQGNFLLGVVRNGKTSQISATDVIEGKTDPQLFNDKIVLVGLTAAGLTQQYPTPQASAAPSVDIYRYAIESLTAGMHTIRTLQFPIWETLFSILLCLILAVGVAHLSTVLAVMFCLLAIFFSWFAAGAIYQNSGYLFSPLLPTLSLTLNSCLLLMLKFYYYQQQAKAETGDTLLLLKSSETNLESILKTIPDIVFRLDANGKIIFISPAISKYLRSPEPLLGHSIFKLIAPEDIDKAQYRINEKRTGKRATSDLELRLLLNHDEAQESWRYFSLSAEGIYYPNDHGPSRFMGTQGILRDITNRKRLEYQLIQAQKMEAIGNLAAGIAHDLNNILSGLVSYPDLLLMEIPKDDPLYQKIEVIQRSGKKAAVIVQDLLTLARRNVTIEEICNLNVIITDYLESVEFQRIKERHPRSKLHTDLQNNLLNINGSSIHLSKVIMNLVNNGLEAMPAGGELLITTADVRLSSHVAGFEHIPEGDYVCASVSDSGVGIPLADLKRIFEPFYSKKSMHLSGTGLGMTVIWATIKDHKGYIDIQSEEGCGTTFKVYLPTTRAGTPDRLDRVVLDDYLGSESILIVDDITEQLDIARNMLTKLGYTVYCAASGEKGLVTLREQPVDLVILDMIMPGGFDGLETYQEIIQLYPQQKAIITSGFSESERVKILRHLGVREYVQKPYTLEKLGMAVRRELDREV